MTNTYKRDLSYINIMMLGDKLYPRGFHPSDQMISPSARGDTKPYRRREVGYVRYYIIDFGLSLCYDDSDMPHLTYGRDGQDQEVPELHTGERYDPFKVDIYTVGNQFQKTFLDVSCLWISKRHFVPNMLFPNHNTELHERRFRITACWCNDRWGPGKKALGRRGTCAI